MRLVLHLYAHCVDDGDAARRATQLEQALSSWSPQAARPPARDRNASQTFTFAYALSPADDTGFRTFIVRSGMRWDLSGDASAPRATWWRDREERFLADQVFRGELWLVDECDLPWHERSMPDCGDDA